MWRSLNLGFLVSPVGKIHFMGFEKQFALHTDSLSTFDICLCTKIIRICVHVYICTYIYVYIIMCRLKHRTRRKETHREGGDRER